ncbi:MULTISPECIES: DUF6624 domain-containing protein [Chryseobacterium]|uniref:DUF6624 domain-containing protein n=1 Tax=Chryseobacterium TaxID=59732 RepID=UPI000A9B044F|nr:MULTISPECIES: DUF6624 domain-containing protein [Chryseobacterium]
MNMVNDSVRREIVKLADHDLQVREKLACEGKLSEGYHPEMEKVHQENAKRLREIIAEIGFPTISKVGEEASDAAWLIIQHSIGEPQFMKACYQMMEENKEDVNPKNRAYLYDRIQVFQSRPQRYGTQLYTAGIFPVENKEMLNEERVKAKLPPLSAKQISQIPEIENIPEIDNKNQEYNSWRKKVGWL